MKMPRRLVAATAALAVAWTALWPLVTSAERVVAGEAMPLCHQAGMQVEPGSVPMDPAPGSGERKQHCPLCVMAFLAAFSPPVVPASPPPALAGATVAMPDSGPRLAADFSLPQSRAPPVRS